MPVMKLNPEQVELLESLSLPAVLSADMGDDEWFEVEDRLANEIQLHGINEAGDGTNDHGEACRHILIAMAEAEDAEAGVIA